MVGYTVYANELHRLNYHRILAASLTYFEQVLITRVFDPICTPTDVAFICDSALTTFLWKIRSYSGTFMMTGLVVLLSYSFKNSRFNLSVHIAILTYKLLQMTANYPDN